jgi:hypothetical protein
MARIYLTGSGPTKGYATGSGIISNPVRILLQERDNKTGSYPTIARTGDPDFTGQYASTFDDTKTILFTGGNLVYPTGLRSTSYWVSGGVATPNILQGLTAQGTSSAGVSDAHVSFTPGQSIGPFNESRIYLDNDSQFYQTGTDPGILPGFDQRLSSKVSISIDTTPTSKSEVFWSTGTLPNASGFSGGVSSGISYFSWADKKWQPFGNLTTGSNVDYQNKSYEVSSSSYLAIAPSTSPTAAGVLDLPAEKVFGMPVSTFGFPFADKFDATGSQLLSLSNSLTAPLLVEKVVFEFSGTLSGPAFRTVLGNPTEPVVQTFVIMRESQSPTQGNFSVPGIYLDRDPFPDVFVETQNTYNTHKHREIVWFGRAASFHNGIFPTAAGIQSQFPEIYESADLWAASEAGTSGYPTGTFRIESPVRVCSQAPFSSALIANRESESLIGDSYFVGNAVGGASLKDISNGRSFIKSIVGSDVTGSYAYLDGLTVNKFTKYFSEAPFVLLPSDKIIFAAIHQIAQDQSFGNRERNTAFRDRLTIAPGASKITLYGSLLRNNLPKESETNQPLTSDAIHEDLHYDNPVYDQWDVEPYTALTGSYVDLIITGSMLATPMGDPTAVNVRKVQASVAAGQAGTTGALQRFVRMSDTAGTLYDSYPPSLSEIYKSSGVGLLATQSFGANVFPIAFSTPDDAGVSSLAVDKSWWLRSAYEISSARFGVTLLLQDRLSSFTIAGTPSGNNFAFPERSIYLLSSSNLVPFNDFIRDDENSAVTEASARRSIAALFGFGDQKYNTPSFISQGATYGTGYRALIRGYKYGLAGLFGSFPDARFRRDRFGQFRDMLEQRRYPATLIGNSVDYPLTIRFVPQDTTSGGTTEPSQTHSQNLSPYATSSLPYFDGRAVDRSDNPDVTLKPVTIEIRTS